jgi:hypothetical protein
MWQVTVVVALGSISTLTPPEAADSTATLPSVMRISASTGSFAWKSQEAIASPLLGSDG